MKRASIALVAVLSATSSTVYAQAVEQRTLVVGRADSAPPRSTADILAVLEQYKPDPAAMARLRQIAARMPPSTGDPVDLGMFFMERGRAAGQLGMVKQQLEDLRRAYATLPKTHFESWFLHRELALAEFAADDFAAALKLNEELPNLSQDDGQRFSAWVTLASVRARTGDLPRARKALSEAESMYARHRGASYWLNI